MITEDYVSFETAMLLKEKGFDAEIKTYWGKALYEPYLEFVPEPRNHEVSNSEGYLTFRGNKDTIEDEEILCIAPTIQMAMKLLREVHNLYINIFVTWRDKIPYYQWSVDNLITQDTICDTPCLEKYKQACEEAIKYCLETL